MESYNSIFSVVVALLATTFFCSYSANSYVSSLAVEQEAKALLQAGWWTHDSLNTSTLSPCNLSGITCNHFGSITHISLPHNSKVQKRLGRFLNSSSFPNLVHLNLAEAGFVGSIPPAIGTLSKLAYLNLSNNNLTGNLSNLRVLNLSSNQINGRMPSTLGLLFNLTHLDISSNKIEGELPNSLACLDQLVELTASYNAINGSIPWDIGKLNYLISLSLSGNMLSGPLPSTIGQLTRLTTLSLASNQISGTIPLEVGKLRNLQSLDLLGNMLNGSLPSTLGQLTKLTYLSLYSNQFNGSVPSQIWNLTNLTHLDLGGNMFNGQIPPTLGRLTNLSELYLDSNQLNGSIPSEIGKLVNLQTLLLSYNMFTGPLPSTLFHLTNLNFLYLSSNQLNGSIPQEVGNLKNLTYLNLWNNSLTGPIPSAICNLTKMKRVTLHQNQLSGSLPAGIGNLKNLTYLDLSFNNLTSPVMPSFGDCLESMNYLNLSHNRLNGTIPNKICTLSESTLDLSYNSIGGEIPSQLQKLKNFTILNLAYNNLSGSIPSSLRSFYQINLSYNRLKGPIPDELANHFPVGAFVGNPDLCGNVTGISLCFQNSPPTDQGVGAKNHKNKKFSYIIRAIVLISVFLALLLVMLGALSYARRFKNNKGQPVSKIRAKNGDIFFILNYDGKIAYHDIIEATEDFDIRYCIGTGGYGSVYRAQLPGGKVVALKKLHGSEVEQPNLRKSFMNEVKTLTEIRHRNIVRLHGFCLNKRCMFLIYEYMERGSLFCVLNNDAEAVELDWSKRVNIIKGIVHALCYMHHDRTPPIVHRDVTSNNILLNAELEAVVSDFGTAKLLDPDSSNQTIIVGTYGYIAPGKFMLLISSSFYICL
ncbi:MDIS1-interacting receptor like kinase 2-like isoform X1 [Ziziphus jujuba]|uniref:non-specific serine/threonine protein kinase n=1 Tax=Ziziphus jujuba TaxID=326968 RepID=A0ABM4A642_ZIZJJ|nr:MDIS1-interacting receptor like kinase 2-like isoform X1 [Ziziphus jujuba]